MTYKPTADGGPAFPRDPGYEGMCQRCHQDLKTSPDWPGMTLRDYFAGQALTGLCRSGVDLNYDEAHIANVCGRLADAMLAERAKPTEDPAQPPTT